MADAAPSPDDVDDARNDRDSPAAVVEFDDFHKEFSSKTKKRDFTWHVKPTSSAASPDDELQMAFFRSADNLKKYAKRHHHELCLAYDFDAFTDKTTGKEVSGGSKLWTSIRDHATFARMALLCDFKDKKIDRWYEILRDEKHSVRFVVDIDFDFAMEVKEKVALLRTYIDSAKIVLKESFHLVLTGLGHLSNHNVEAKKLNGAIEKVFVASCNFIQFEKYCKRNSEGALQTFLDANIYSHWRSMRLPLMVKARLDPEKERPFYPVEVDFELNTITKIPHAYEDGFADTFPDYMASFVTPDEMKASITPENSTSFCA
ncbi:hypothetical protein CYMTET_25523 [Cymbomonas tetramitiformis]|uniref:Uncharacterized protein n=1 Tax=Cymbomonas tetramitiformis TaxID=36881 RepID=A0AAE0FTW9_9CHLO|nr:hypothetical protein CYMTET_25523 [Cymbomonas tetramitiformis]